MTLGINLKDGIGVDASLTALSVGVNYSFIDVSFNFFSIGASFIFKEKRVKVSFGEIFGLEISVNLKELWKYLNEEED